MTGSRSSGSMKSQVRRRHKEVLWEKQSGICFWCKEAMDQSGEHGNAATLDHVIPRAKGGSNMRDNLVLAHSRCNYNRTNKSESESHRVADHLTTIKKEFL